GPSAKSAPADAQKLSESIRKKLPIDTTAATPPARLGATARATRRGAREEGGGEHRVEDAEEERRRHERRDSELPAQREDSEHHERERPPQVRRDHRPAPIEPVRDHPAERRER